MSLNAFGDLDDWVRERPGWEMRGDRVGGDLLGASVYELAPGAKSFPYHWHSTEEELLVVLSGRPTLRHPGGEQELSPGDTFLFPCGPDGAHLLRNDGDEPCRLLIASNLAEAGIVVYPDSGKIGAWSGDTKLLVRESESQRDYWEGEA